MLLANEGASYSAGGRAHQAVKHAHNSTTRDTTSESCEKLYTGSHMSEGIPTQNVYAAVMSGASHDDSQYKNQEDAFHISRSAANRLGVCTTYCTQA